MSCALIIVFVSLNNDFRKGNDVFEEINGENETINNSIHEIENESLEVISSISYSNTDSCSTLD